MIILVNRENFSTFWSCEKAWEIFEQLEELDNKNLIGTYFRRCDLSKYIVSCNQIRHRRRNT